MFLVFLINVFISEGFSNEILGKDRTSVTLSIFLFILFNVLIFLFPTIEILTEMLISIFYTFKT